MTTRTDRKGFSARIFLVLAVLPFLAFSCASKDAPPDETPVPAVTPAAPAEKAPAPAPASGGGSSAPGTSSGSAPQVTFGKTGAFYLKDATILLDIETATPQSLRQAVSKLRRADENYSQDEATLLSVATAIMTYVWPSQKVTWTTPATVPENAYTGAIDSVKKGVYDYNTGRSDYLSLVLPSLLLGLQTVPQSLSTWRGQAEADLLLALDCAPADSVLAPYLLAKLYAAQNRFLEALPHAEKVFRSQGAIYEAAFLQATVLHGCGRFDEALAILEQLEQKDPYNTDLMKLAALCTFEIGNNDRAERYVAQILQREPDNEEYLLFRAKILFRKGEYLSVSSLLDAYAKRNPTNLDYLLLRARLFYDWNKNTTQAANTLQQALTLYPGNTEVLLFAANLAAETGQAVGGRTARMLLEELLAVDPENVETRRLVVAQAVLEEDWAKAYSASSTVLEDADLQTLLTHTTICLELNRIAEAESIATELYRDYPEDQSVQQQYIRVLIASGRSAQALVLIERLLPEATGKNKSTLYYERSRLSSSQEARLADLRSSLTANPRNQDALYSLYEYYFARSDYRKAQYYLKQLIALNSGNGKYLALNTELDSLVNRQ